MNSDHSRWGIMLVLYLLPLFMLGQTVQVDKLSSLQDSISQLLPEHPLQADSLAQIGLREAEPLNDGNLIATFQVWLAQSAYYLGKWDQGIRHGRAALTWLKKQADPDLTLLYRAVSTMGNLYIRLRALDDAHDAFTEQLMIAEQQEDLPHVAAARSNLSVVYTLSEDYEASLKELYIALDILQDLQDTVGMINVWGNIGEVNRKQEQLEESLSHFERASSLAKAGQHTYIYTWLLLDRANILFDLRGAEGTDHLIREADSLLASVKHPFIKVAVRMAQSYSAMLREDWPTFDDRIAEVDSLLIQHPASTLYWDRNRIVLKAHIQRGLFEEALAMQRQIHAHEDSLRDSDIRQQIANLRSTQELGKAQREITQQQKLIIWQRDQSNWLWGFFVFTFFIAILIARQQVRLKKSLQKQKAQAQQLTQQARALADTHRELEQANQGLEAKVQARTASLQQLNDQILQHSFLNSHVLRQPLANILGLVSLIEEEGFLPDSSLLTLLRRSAEQLDVTVKEINQHLEQALEEAEADLQSHEE